ncbi:DUF4439 domain-containing protein [Intrasporangium flavum]|uniref:DUF4439 domain-containing protein n=1 Tax=Intrasporangium flavum TaxID=1428657 RepID=UPI00096D0CC5|nr:DUF4439 domain-containing protein [Intrasporangium flavum]
MDGDIGERGPRLSERLGRPPRRLLLLGGGAAVLAVLVDRGLRLDLPQPPPPVPTRRKAPDEDLLLSVVADLSVLVTAADDLVSAGAGGTVRRVRTVLREQRRVLTGRLTNAGVPSSVIAAAEKKAAAAAPPVRTRADLAARLADVPRTRWAQVAEATADTRSLLLAALSAQIAGSALLGADVAVPDPASPSRPTIVARTQPLVYAFEVVAAQAGAEDRGRAADTLAGLTRLEIATSGTSPTMPSGWALPFPVTTPADASRLAHEVLADSVDATVEVAGTAPNAASVEDAARWAARIQALAVDWDVPLTAFPGATP